MLQEVLNLSTANDTPEIFNLTEAKFKEIYQNLKNQVNLKRDGSFDDLIKTAFEAFAEENERAAVVYVVGILHGTHAVRQVSMEEDSFLELLQAVLSEEEAEETEESK